MTNQKTCFIIMPISTTDGIKDLYRDGHEHFKHVLDCLLIPAVDRSGFKPIPPTAKGSELIHANIIKHLETSDLVLCDISSLNPNVFFEFGIRTSLNKPVCVIKDDLTNNVPFDTGIINYHEYLSTLEPWELNNEIDKLSEHIKSSFQRSEEKNTLWKYFGLKAEATAYESAPGPDSRMDYITMQLEALNRRLGTKNQISLFSDDFKIQKDDLHKDYDKYDIFDLLDAINNDPNIVFEEYHTAGNTVNIMYSGIMNSKTEHILRTRINKLRPNYIFTFNKFVEE